MTNTYRKSDTYKYYDVDKNVTVEDAIDCSRCKSVTVAKLDLITNGIKLIEFDPYYEDNTQILHQHSADRQTKARILERVATNKRLLGEMDPGDHHYPSRREMN